MKWSDKEVSELLAMRESGASTVEMGRRLFRTRHAIYVKLAKLDKPVIRQGQKEWSVAEKSQLVYLKEVVGLGWTEISRRMGRPSGTVYSKYAYIRNFASTKHNDQPVVAKIPQETISEWRYRRALSPSNLTAHFCGDPLPGYSALDRRA
jgi:hypothetical protein